MPEAQCKAQVHYMYIHADSEVEVYRHYYLIIAMINMYVSLLIIYR